MRHQRRSTLQVQRGEEVGRWKDPRAQVILKVFGIGMHCRIYIKLILLSLLVPSIYSKSNLFISVFFFFLRGVGVEQATSLNVISL